VEAADAHDPEIVTNAFGSLADELRGIMNASSQEQEKWANRISIGSDRTAIKRDWRDAFDRFGSYPYVQKLQVERARNKYWNMAKADGEALRLTSDMGYALCFDIAVQNGGVSKREEELFKDQTRYERASSATDRRKV